MKKILFRLSLAIFLASVFPVSAQQKHQPKARQSSARAQIAVKIAVLLDAYSRRDARKIMTLFGEKDVLMMGADKAESAATRAEIEKLLNDDFSLWDSSTFGKIENYHLQIFAGETAASTFFDAPWEAETSGGRRKFTVRLAIVWRKSKGDWKIAQILNAVPTVGQSAAEIKKQMKK